VQKCRELRDISLRIGGKSPWLRDETVAGRHAQFQVSQWSAAAFAPAAKGDAAIRGFARVKTG